jgi:hypothetical protein
VGGDLLERQRDDGCASRIGFGWVAMHDGAYERAEHAACRTACPKPDVSIRYRAGFICGRWPCSKELTELAAVGHLAEPGQRAQPDEPLAYLGKDRCTGRTE